MKPRRHGEEKSKEFGMQLMHTVDNRYCAAYPLYPLPYTSRIYRRRLIQTSAISALVVTIEKLPELSAKDFAKSSKKPEKVKDKELQRKGRWCVFQHHKSHHDKDIQDLLILTLHS
ncbi:hypothetical protein AKJ16_DCAP21456 [Drosera capensis]